MRAVNEITADMEGLFFLGDIELIPGAPEKFKTLFVEYMEAHGNIVLDAECPQCGAKLDNEEGPRLWEFRYGASIPVILYTCPHCNVEVPMTIVTPAASAYMN